MQKKLKINRQNFQGEITSGFIVKLEKLTQENIRLAMREKNMGENQNKTHASSNTFKAVSTGFVSRIKKQQQKERGKNVHRQSLNYGYWK